MLELKFAVDQLHISLVKSTKDKETRALGTVSLESFSLSCNKAEHFLEVNVSLRCALISVHSLVTDQHRSLYINVNQASGDPLLLLSSKTSGFTESGTDLMNVRYTDVQRSSPEFETTFHSVDQDICILMSTVVFQIAPEPVIAVYDFLITTFTNDRIGDISQDPEPTTVAEDSAVQPTNRSNMMRITVRLDAIESMTPSIVILVLDKSAQ